MTHIDTNLHKQISRRNRFDLWLTERGITNYAAAKKLHDFGYSLSVERIRQLRFNMDDPRYCAPHWPTIEAIYSLTDGAIGPNDWADPYKFPGLHT